MHPPTPEEIQAMTLNAAQQLVAMWPLMLDGIEGMVQQTIARGFTEREARVLVISSICGRY